MSWLDHVPPAERALLLGGVTVVLGVPTVALGRLEIPHLAADLVAFGAATLAGGAVALAWRRHGAPAARLRAARREQAELDQERDRGIAVAAWTPPAAGALDRLAARDPAFSVPLLLAAIRTLVPASPTAAAEVIDAGTDGDLLAVDAIVRTAGGALRVRVTCDPTARAPRPDAIPGPWKLASAVPVPPPARPAVRRDPAVSAARRALAAREALDPPALEALAREISAAIDAGDAAAAPYLTEDGRADLAFWRAVGLPAGGEDVDWLEVVQDGWFDRIEVRLGARVLSLRRLAGHPEAPWELWRVRSAT